MKSSLILQNKIQAQPCCVFHLEIRELLKTTDPTCIMYLVKGGEGYCLTAK